jgi:ATP-dependent DNA ligase
MVRLSLRKRHEPAMRDTDRPYNRPMPPEGLPFPPMEAQLVRELPTGEAWQYEPKWDGFRGVLENLDGELHLWSRNERPLLRYFPELAPLGERLPPRSALDGEIVIEREGRLDFDAMQMRLHPAESRIRRLSVEIPARFVVFDVLLWKKEKVWQLHLEERRGRVEALPFDISPASQEESEAREWMERLDVAGFDGVVAKRLGEPYRPGSREAVVKVKRIQTADCAVIGLRWAEGRERIATMLLGLYDDGGELRYVGSAAVAPARHDEIAALLKPLLKGATERSFNEPNRWGTGELEQAAVRPELVVEVRYDKWQGMRFRHGTKLLRFRPDKDPGQCTVEQVRPLPRRGDPTVSGLLTR